MEPIKGQPYRFNAFGLPVSVGPIQWQNTPFGLGRFFGGEVDRREVDPRFRLDNLMDIVGSQALDKSTRDIAPSTFGGDTPFGRDVRALADTTGRFGKNVVDATGNMISGPLDAISMAPYAMSDYFTGSKFLQPETYGESAPTGQLVPSPKAAPGNDFNTMLEALIGKETTEFSTPWKSPAGLMPNVAMVPKFAEMAKGDYSKSRAALDAGKAKLASIGLRDADLPMFLLSALAKSGIGTDQDFSQTLLKLGLGSIGAIGEFGIKQREVENEKALREASFAQELSALERGITQSDLGVDEFNARNEASRTLTNTDAQNRANAARAELGLKLWEMDQPKFSGGQMITSSVSPDGTSRNYSVRPLDGGFERRLALAAVAMDSQNVPSLSASIMSNSDGLPPEERAAVMSIIQKAMPEIMTRPELSMAKGDKMQEMLAMQALDSYLMELDPQSYAENMQRIQQHKQRQAMVRLLMGQKKVFE